MSVTRRRFLHDSAVLVTAAAASRPIRGQSADFDFIVVGAGSSGCVVVNRLTADPSIRVLLLEAGGPATSPAITDPGQWTTLLGSAVDWGYRTEPEPGLDGRTIDWPRGRVYGGSSSIHAMAHLRGHQLDFDGWAEAADDSWSYTAVLPYFKRSEDNSRGASDYLGAGGPLGVTDQTDPHAGHDAFLAAAEELGFSAAPTWDFNGRQQEQGAGFYQKTIRDGRRESSATAFLRPALDRPNLTVTPRALVRRVVFDGVRASGVEYAAGDRVETARAARGVILTAGAIESPKILMLSGIGPAGELRSHGVRVLRDIAEVGANLQDHPRVSLRWEGTGALPPSGVSAGLLTYSCRRPAAVPPDIQFYVGRGIDQPDPFITLTLAFTRPRSRGSISLRSANAAAAPLIRANYFAEPSDLDALVEGVRLARAFAGSTPYARLRGNALDPDDTVRTPAEIRAHIRRASGTMFHPVGTCRMGRDRASVVDPQLRVRGVDGLWVADASIMPTVVNSQTNAACLMIGERAAELVRRG